MNLRTIPLGMVGIDNNSMKAYIAMMAAHGMQPRTIIYLETKIGGIKFNLLKKILGERLAKNIYMMKRYYQQRKYKKFSQLFSDDIDVGNLFFSPPNYAKSCQNYSVIDTNDINDPQVVEMLRRSGEQIFIYGGGGIVRPVIFDLGIKFIHTHPGYLPYVRGSHAIYWSLLVRGKFGCTTFYMNQGIDTGAIIKAKEYDKNTFVMPVVDVDMADKLMFFYVDPLLRAMTLIDVLTKHERFDDIDSSPQDNSFGEAYYSMHLRLRYKIVKRMMLDSAIL
jgi:hypothetical protein